MPEGRGRLAEVMQESGSSTCSQQRAAVTDKHTSVDGYTPHTTYLLPTRLVVEAFNYSDPNAITAQLLAAGNSCRRPL